MSAAPVRVMEEPHGGFAFASRDELWAGGSCIESRLQHGRADVKGDVIVASDAADRELVAAVEEETDALRTAATWVPDAQLQLVASARRVAGVTIRSATLTITLRGVAVVSNAVEARRDAEALRALLERDPEAEYEPMPIAWRNGSAAVLLHEAIGHPAEHDTALVRWPRWLTVHDEPEAAVDDRGTSSRVSDLLVEAPASFRRASFRDVPIRRMTRLVVRQQDAPAAIPGRRIDVHVVSGGAWDPLTDDVSLRVVIADEISETGTRRLRPFTFVRPRREIADSMVAAAGEPERYPGVICSREGQALVVGSFAPVIVTS